MIVTQEEAVEREKGFSTDKNLGVQGGKGKRLRICILAKIYLGDDGCKNWSQRHHGCLRSILKKETPMGGVFYQSSSADSKDLFPPYF